MKTLLTFALAMSMILTGYAEPNNDLAALSSISHNYQMAKVKLLEGAGRVQVSVLDSEGRLLHCTSIKVKEDVILPLNLESLPLGEYVIRIKSKEASVDYAVTTEPMEEEKAEFKALVKSMDPFNVKVSVYELNNGGVTVKIYNKNNRLIYQEFVDQGPFAKKYYLKNLVTDDVYFSITDENGKEQIYYI